MPIPFSELAPDVLFSIFACCDISSVVSISQTCRNLHDLAHHKSVWLVLVGDLRQKSILDSALDLQDLSTDDLINLVKSLLTGPETWSPRDSGFIPELSKEIVLHPKIAHGLYWENEAKLVPSERYVLFNNWHTLECWDVAEDRLVWKHASIVEHASVLEFAAEEIEGDNVLVVMICERTYPNNRGQENFVEIVEVDLRTVTHRVLILTRAPDTAYDNPFSHPVILGTIAAVGTTRPTDRYFFVNWKTQASFVLHGGQRSLSLVALIPGHVILKAASTDGEEEIHVISNDALHSHLIPAIGFADICEFNTVLPDQIAKLSTLSDPDAWETFFGMSVHASPIHDGEYRVWVSGSAYLWSYQLSLPIGQPPQWRQRGLVPAQQRASYQEIAYSGHSLIYDDPRRSIVPATLTSHSGEMDLEGCGDCVHIAPYSGALIYSTDISVVIRYFK
ncbi:hypothetical protein DFH09DRAFT_1374215 [Mycena vulgaris]|nr:hypothetical protein DFH09DRAFT_1374215 [Mycena vulgaris]